MKNKSHETKSETKSDANGKGFRTFATKTAAAVGHPLTFLGAALLIVVWAVLGPVFHFADTWQLVINTATTIITFLMVFLIQNTQNRDAKAIHLKLDELINVAQGARKQLIDLEDLSEEEMEKLQKEFVAMRKRVGKKCPPAKQPGE